MKERENERYLANSNSNSNNIIWKKLLAESKERRLNAMALHH